METIRLDEALWRDACAEDLDADPDEARALTHLNLQRTTQGQIERTLQGIEAEAWQQLTREELTA